MNDIQSHIAVLRPRAGDTIAVRVDARWLTREQHDSIRRHCEKALPRGVNVIVMDSQISLTHIVGPMADCPAPESLHFDTWMRDRTERAHREHMERIRNLPPCDTSIEGVARYLGAPI